MPKKEVTIYDIARHLGISTSTVSRGLQNHSAVNKVTKRRISETAKELGYRYNPFAGRLRKQQSNTIGVIVHELNSNFITSVIAGIEKITTTAGYDLIITHSSESYAQEAANAQNLFHKRVDGLIASLAYDTNDLSHFQPYIDKGIPVIFCDRVEENTNNTVVIIDNYKCGYQVTQHLIEQGCKRIVHVTANLKRNVYGHRYKGYRDALFDNGIQFDKNHLIINDLGEEACIRAVKQMLAMKPLPDGLFVTNDFSAAVCMHALKEHGIAIPDDIAVAGFNNDAICKIVDPQLTTVNYPGIDVGEIAARNLINHLQGVNSLEQTNTIIVRSELIVRGSSLKKSV